MTFPTYLYKPIIGSLLILLIFCIIQLNAKKAPYIIFGIPLICLFVYVLLPSKDFYIKEFENRTKIILPQDIKVMYSESSRPNWHRDNFSRAIFYVDHGFYNQLKASYTFDSSCCERYTNGNGIETVNCKKRWYLPPVQRYSGINVAGFILKQNEFGGKIEWGLFSDGVSIYYRYSNYN